jgi:hypothetical protein
MRRFVLLALLFTSAAFANGQPAGQAETKPEDEKVAEVAIEGIKNPALRSYRTMSAGLDAFDEHRRLAPAAALKFKLIRRTAIYGEATSWDGVSLRVAGNDFSIPLPIAPDGTFVLPRSQTAHAEDADLVLNQKKSTVSFAPDVRSPGLPANARRLGDLRLQCEVLLAVEKKEMSLALRAFFNTAFMGGDWCRAKHAKVGVPLGDWSMSTVLAYGDKRIPLPGEGYKITAPIQDKALPDDALIEFEFWSKASAQRKREFLAQTQLYVKSSINKWGDGAALRALADGRYSAVMPLQKGKWKFRLESPGGYLAAGGAARDTPAALDSELQLKYHGGRLEISVEQAGAYEFLLDLRDPDRPVMTVRRQEAT